MNKIKVSELFYSLQGEGKYVGTPSVFLRTFGCNFKCAGFGMPRGKLSEERERVDPGKYVSYDSLPLVSTGCDSYASWDPRFKSFSPVLSIEEIVNKVLSLLPNKRWAKEHLIITGGEPLLGWQKAYPALLQHLDMRCLDGLTIETNGTQRLEDSFKWTLEEMGRDRVTFSVSAKLPNSGENWEDAIQPDVLFEYWPYGDVYLKFVIGTEQDLADAERAVDQYRQAGVFCPVYLMSVGGVEEVYNLHHKQVAQFALNKGWKYSPRLQVELWKNAWAT